MVLYDPLNLARAKIAKPVLLPQALGHQTPAVRTLYGLANAAVRGFAGGRKRRKKRHHKKGLKLHKKRHHKRKAKHVKGSRGMRAHMARLRGMRGKGKAA